MRLFEFDIHLGRWRVLVQDRDIQSGAIKSYHIAPEAITGRNIADNAIQNRHIQIVSIEGRCIADNTIDSKKIKDRSVEGRNIARGAVDLSKIAPGTLDGLDVIRNANLLGLDMDEKGNLIAYYGDRGQPIGIEMDERGNCYMVFGDPDHYPHSEGIDAAMTNNENNYEDLTPFV